MRRLRPLIRFFSTNSAIAPAQPSFDPYSVDPEQYRDLHLKVKYSSGYAGIQIEPFPRLKIMEIGRFLLHNVAQGIPEDALQRIYIEEYVKHVMELTHNTPNILELQTRLATDCIELFIEQFSEYMKIIDLLREERIWEDQPVDPEEAAFFQRAKTPYAELMEYEKISQEMTKPLLKKD
jgi:hypothetical protein